MADKAELYWMEGDRKVTREVRLTLNIEDYKHLAIYPFLVMTANPHLSAVDIFIWLLNTGGNVKRPIGWISKRRWMTRPVRGATGRANADSKDEAAFELMRHPNYRELSVRDLVKVLAEHGIHRGREWVRQHRCDDYRQPSTAN